MSIAHILDRAAEATQWQEALYKDLHQHPELSMEEERTRGVIADKLREFPGVEVLEFGGGVVGILRNGVGSTVLERADFDGLPITEDTGLDYSASGEAMHACGHDAHVSALLGATEALAKATDAWSGTFVALFQPGEETAEGAQSMVDAGLTDRVPTSDVAFGQHIFIDKNAPAGSVLIAPGPVLSTATSLTVTVYGHGSHGSMPHLSVDPVVLASSIVLRLQTIVSREVDPHHFAVLTVGALQAGSKANIIPDAATLRINIRAYDEDVRAQIVEAIHRIVKAECRAAMSPREPEFVQSDNYPLTVNDEDVTKKVRAQLIEVLGSDNVLDMEPWTASEDFSRIPDAFGAPYCFWGFGGRTDGASIPNHNPRFAPELQPTLTTATQALIAAAYAYLGNQRKDVPKE
ncbi:amidohydrolase [Corynebacterium aurimucosum]|uniref:Amidohydrolase n=1 Tax=Corynebacterium aurimucosum TaxID=169292 RepID=A0A558GIK6_9CORY|nr:amidohydrolase [Corynebacterium sp. HMSC072D12]OFQ34356.1 amidohydrolase [Corynebacterium sp. HMSC072D12]TVU56717.1 amidohydrolase [Corynebacterium aurimucosum]